MTKPKNAKRRRHSIPKDASPSDFMTASEARGEAAWVVMHALLRRIPRSICKRAMVAAYANCDSLNVKAITNEVESLFWNIEFRDEA